MKKFLAFVLVLLMTSSLAACSTTTTPPGNTGTDWPTGNIEIVIPYNPGGDTDTYARAMLEGLSAELGVTVTITNMTGSSGAVAAEYVQAAEPDGNTVLFWHSSILTNKIFGNADYSYEAYALAVIFIAWKIVSAVRNSKKA